VSWSDAVTFASAVFVLMLSVVVVVGLIKGVFS